MTKRIYDRFPESELDFRVRLVEPYRDGKFNDPVTSPNADGEYPYDRDWFGVSLISTSYRTTNVPPVILYNEDDFFNMDAVSSAAYLRRYSSSIGTIKLNHLLNFPASVQQLVKSNQLNPATKQTILANMLCHEIVLRISDPKVTKPKDNKHLIRSPINLDTLNELEFTEVLAHGYVNVDTSPMYLKDILGLYGKRNPTKSADVFAMVSKLLSVTDLFLEVYNSKGLGEFLIITPFSGDAKETTSLGKSKVSSSLIPKVVISKLPPIAVLKEEMDRVAMLQTLLQEEAEKCDGDLFGDVEDYAKSIEVDGFPRSSLNSTNPMYGVLLNNQVDVCKIDYWSSTPFIIGKGLSIYSKLVDAGLFRYEVVPRRTSYWDGIRANKVLRGGSYSDRRNGNTFNVQAFISPVLSHILGIFIMSRSKESGANLSNASWMYELGLYLKGLGEEYDLVKALSQLNSLENFVAKMNKAFDSLSPDSTLDRELDGISMGDLVADVNYSGVMLDGSQSYVGSFLVADLTKV